MKYLNTIRTVTTVVTFSFLAALPANANNIEVKNVKVTPLGSHKGEFCYKDRALILEDPKGTRILYDPGRTVAGADDPRLGKIDVVLVTHMHGDHVGDAHILKVKSNAGKKPCDGKLELQNDLPNTNAAKIAKAKNALIVTGSEMPKFFEEKLKALGGDPKKSKRANFGALYKVGGVEITTVPATHPNGVDGDMIGGELGSLLSAAGLSAYVGPATGYVLTFSNKLAVYLSGDTGITAEQDTVVRQHYGAKLVVMNIGDTFTTGPKEAAWVIDELIKPVSVIASHANEAATKDGKLRTDIKTKTESFIEATKTAKVYVPLSGITMEFDGTGKCVAGC